jgi:hypothetical protein
LKKQLKSEKISESTLIPVAWIWYDSELLDIIDENGDGKADEKFGKKFKIIYLARNESIKEFEKESLYIQKSNIKNIQLKYVILKNKA